MKPPRIALLSSTAFGKRCLDEALLCIPEIEVAGILTTPKDIHFPGSGKNMSISRHTVFLDWAKSNNIPIRSFSNPPSSEDYRDFLQTHRVDCCLALGWYFMVPTPIVNNTLCLGIHASLLPQYRGGAPLVWAIINGEKETGVTIFRLTDTMDAGNTYGQRKIPICKDDTIAELYSKSEEASILLLQKTLPGIMSGINTGKPQNESHASCYPMRTPEDGRINWERRSVEVYNFIRAQTRPYPGAFTEVDGNKIAIWAALPHETTKRFMPGTFFTDVTGATCVSCGEGTAIRIIESGNVDG